MNTVAIYDLVNAVRDFFVGVPLAEFAESIATEFDYRHADEEADTVLGLHLPVPAIIVAGEIEEGLLSSKSRITVKVRHSQEDSTFAAHNDDAKAVADALMALPTITAGEIAFGFLPHSFSGVSFERVGRAYESSISGSMVPL